ncbi:hypothetical protein Tco_1006144 [Tanacetum coccineum]|uniref:Gag-Pol polyprotein n=1 Tax=Tanacetum coccineum TaxID=301880 RepID=A0ABQ5FH95_9ASTR
MMKGSDIGNQEKKAKLFNEWERFTCTDEESIESYYHHFSKLMNDFKRNKHFPEKIANNLKFLNNLQLEWSRHVTIVHQTKDLHIVDYTQLYDFLKYNQKEVVQNAVQNLGVQNVGNQNGLIVVSGIANQNPNGNRNVVVSRAEGNAIGNNEAGIQFQAEEFDLMAATADLDEIEEVNANCILMANLQRALTSGTQTDKAPVYDSDRSAEPILEPHQVQQNDTNVISEVYSIEQDGGTIDQHPATVEETRLELEIEHLLRAVVSQDIMSIMQSKSVADTSILQTELERVDNTAKTRRPQPRGDTMNRIRVPSALRVVLQQEYRKLEVEEHPRNLLLSKNKKHMSSECNNVKLAIRNDKSEVVCAICKQCLITANHDVCVLNYVNDINSHSMKQKANISNIANLFMVYRLGLFQAYNGESEPSRQLRLEVFRNLSEILRLSVESLGYNLFSVGQFCDSDLEVTFERNTYFVRNLEGVDLLKRNRTTNLYTINLYEMASASPICLMARATSTKS